MTYPFFILLLLFLLYYCLCQITYESFHVDDQQSKARAVMGVKKRKQILKNAQKENVVVVMPSLGSAADKKMEKVIKKNFNKELVSVITFTDKILIKEFLSNLTPITPTRFPAYYKINTSISENNHMDIITNKPNIVNNIDKEYKKLKVYSSKDIKKETETEKEKTKKDIGKNLKNTAATVVDKIPNNVKDLGKNIGKNIGKGASNIGKKIGFGKK